MKRPWWLGAVGFCLTFAGAAGAKETGVEIGLRSGYAVPLGNAVGDEKLSRVVTGIVPLWFDLGYRLTPNVMLGAYFQYGFGLVSSNLGGDCDTLDCSVSNTRLGVQVQYHFLPWKAVDPWLGAGVGYEWMTISASGSINGQSRAVSGTLQGVEFINLQGGPERGALRS